MRFTQEQVQTLRGLRDLWPLEAFSLVGASALGCFTEFNWRRTHDLDLCAAVGLADYPGGVERLPGWSGDARLEQRWYSPEGVAVDIIPASAELIRDGEIIWPRTGRRMSLVGFRLAFSHGVPVPISEELVVKAAPIPVLTLLKMVAYLDSPDTRSRDLGDIAHMLDLFLPPDAEERFVDEVFAVGLRDDEISPYFLGRKLSELADELEADVIRRFVELVVGGDRDSQALYLMARDGPGCLRGEAEQVIKRMRAFERGLSA